jgi:XTP/dITP diphosphohydrolase
MIKRLLVATKNKNKLKEISDILKELNIEIVSAYEKIKDDFEIEETAESFEGNANLKSLYISNLTNEYVIADDSGLEVEFLNNAPGIYSARFAGDDASDNDNNIKLLDLLKNVPMDSRNARFVCVISLAKEGKIIETFFGKCDGRIDFKQSGKNGFGYDSLFLLDNGKKMAEITSEEKNKVSHRKDALEQLKKFIMEVDS